MIEDMERDMSVTLMVILTKEISKEERQMVMEFIDGEMEKFMKVNG